MEDHWRSVVDEVNEARGDGEKYFLRAKMWDVYMREKILIIKFGYYVEV